MHYYSSSSINGIGLSSLKKSFILLFLLLSFQQSITTTSSESQPNVEFPDIIDTQNFMFAAVSQESKFLSNGQRIETTDIWILSFRKNKSVDNVTYRIVIDENHTQYKTTEFGHDSVSDRSWLSLEIPEREEFTRIEIFYDRIVNQNITLPIGFEFIYRTPLSERDANISIGELNSKIVIAVLIGVVIALTGDYFATRLRHASPALELPQPLMVMMSFFIGAIAVFFGSIGFAGISQIIAYVAVGIGGFVFGLSNYKMDAETMLTIDVDEKVQSINPHVYYGKRIDEDYFELYEPGWKAIFKLFGRKSYVRYVKPIRNSWASPYNYTTFIQDKEVKDSFTRLQVEITSQELEITRSILESNRYLHIRRLAADEYKLLKDKHNSMVAYLDQYVGVLVSQQLFEIHGLQPSASIKEEQEKVLEDLQKFDLVENWELRSEVLAGQTIEEFLDKYNVKETSEVKEDIKIDEPRNKEKEHN